MNKIIHWFILPCSKITCQIEKKQAGKATFIQRLQIALHLSVCKFCNAYNKKVIMLDVAMNKIIKREKETQIENFDEQEFKSRLKKNLKK